MNGEQVFAFMLILSRVSAFIAFFPIFGGNQMPMLVKAGLATSLTVFWYGAVPLPTEAVGSLSTLAAILMIGQEVGIGLLLAMVLGFMLWPARIAGSYIGQEIGLSMDPVTNSGNEQSSMMASIFESLAVLMFFGLNLHHFLITILHHSMLQLSGKIQLLNLPTEGLIRMIDQISELGLLVLAPIGVLSFVIVIGLFFLSKAAPSMNLFSVGMPLRVGLGLFGLIMFLPVIIRSVESVFQRTLTDVEQLLSYFN